jgi:hypothetical protein
MALFYSVFIQLPFVLFFCVIFDGSGLIFNSICVSLSFLTLGFYNNLIPLIQFLPKNFAGIEILSITHFDALRMLTQSLIICLG